MCDHVTDFIDWQWNVNQWTKQDSPAAALNLYLTGVLEAPFADSDKIALEWLAYGQRENATALDAYRRCFTFGAEHVFNTVGRASGDRSPDFAALEVHVEWQTYSCPISFLDARLALRSGLKREIKELLALYRCLNGMSINSNACQLYRACWAADKGRFFSIIDEYLSRLAAGTLRHPYLDSQPATAVSLSNRVPDRK